MVFSRYDIILADLNSKRTKLREVTPCIWRFAALFLGTLNMLTYYNGEPDLIDSEIWTMLGANKELPLLL
jgi:hypothetical protein